MKAIVARSALIFALGFLLLFVMRLGYGYVDQPNGEIIYRGSVSQSLGYDFELSRKNYAGQKQSLGGVGPASVDQRYEKVATLGQSSAEFDSDEALVRSVAEGANALIQHEQAFGLTGQRQLQLALGVPPASFDDVINKLREIGRPVSFQVNKTDKTNEYRALLAQQQSLKKSRDSLIELKARDADLADLISLERQILDLENQIQSLGVSVGEFDSEFEFATIKLTLSEVPSPVARFISFLDRAKVALEWAIMASLGIAFALFLFSVAGVLIMLLVQMVQRASAGESSK